jgi:predicted DNA-binding transcriptional regulator AlpA
MTDDPLLPAAEVTKRYSVSSMTIYRWVRDNSLSFPAPIYINKRRYWRVSELVSWERSRVTGGAA